MAGRIIVTGGAGFIGSNIVRALNARGRDDVLVVDRLGRDAKWRNLLGTTVTDVLHKDTFRRLIRDDALGDDVTAVIHMGACSATTETDADYLLDNNTRYTRELCAWCLRHDVRFIYASSAATYGDGRRGYDDDPARLPDLRPLNMYGFSKHLFDLWAWREGLLDRIVGLKFFNVYGPGEDHKGEMRSVIHKAYGQILEHGRVRLFRSYRPEYPDGGQVRDFVFVDDAVAVTLFFLDHPELGGIYNCGTGKARTWLDLARGVFAAMGREPEIEFIDMPPELRDRYQYHTEADLARLRAAGYDRPFTELEDGIRAYVERHLGHPDGPFGGRR